MKTKVMTVLMAAMAILLFTQCDDDNIDPDQLPELAKNFLQTNYPNQNYTVEKENKNGKVIYEVDLNGGVEVEFNEKGDCIYVGGKSTQVPDTVLHSKIKDYVAEHYPNATIVEWELEANHQEVELSSNIELLFDLESNFLFSRHDDDDEDDDDKIISKSDLPDAVHTFIETHFPDATISLVTKETEHNITEYEVRLSNAFELDFNAAGECTGIDGNTKKIPDSALDSKMVEYVKTNYTPAFITEWDLDARNQEVELNNGHELTFDLQGNFLYAER